MEIASRLMQSVKSPFLITWQDNSLKCILVCLGIYGMSALAVYGTRPNLREGEEHGSAKWGTPRQLNSVLEQKENFLLTKRVRLGMDTHKHRRNLNTLVLGGSGAGKTRFLALPNIMEANCSYVTTVSWNGDICQTNVSGKPAIQRDYHINIECIGNDYSAIASLVMQRVHHGGCICVLMNTVNRAQQVYLELKNHIDPNTKLLLFHARYPAETRQDIEDQCTFLFGKEAGANRPRRAILVCTQVMEQSLDVDFDSMITDLATIDLLLQRMGRVHRFSKTIRPSDLLKPFITIIAGKNAEEDCDNDSIYAPLFLRRTLRLLQQKENIQVPEEMRQLTNTVYSGLLGNQEEISRWTKQKFMDSQFATAAQMELWGEPDTRSVFFSEQAGHFRLEEEERPFCQRAKTRLTDDSIRMVFVTAEEMGRFRQDFLGGVYDKTFAQSVLKRAFSIRLPAKWDIGNLPKGVYRGTGLLCGVFLLESENESFEWDTLRIWNDSDLGIRQERRR